MIEDFRYYWSGLKANLRPRFTTPSAKNTTCTIQIDSPAHEKLSGLVNVRGWAFSGLSHFPEGKLVVSLDEGNSLEVVNRFPFAIPTLEATQTLKSGYKFVLNTHLLSNGTHTLKLNLLSREGKQVVAIEHELLIENAGDLANQVANELKLHGSPVLFLETVDSSHFPVESGGKLRPWFDRPDALERIPSILTKHGLSTDYQQRLKQFVDEGYLVIDNFVPKNLVDTINRDVEKAITSGEVAYRPGSGERIELMFRRSVEVRQLWKHPQVMKLLNAIFDDVALPCQTLNYLHGSTQDAHQDTIHLTPFPEGYMCGVWVALEDIHPDAGPLFVYPKSHRIPTLYSKTVGMKKITTDWSEYAEKYLPQLKQRLEERGLTPFYYTPKAGSLLVWHSNLAHGGSERKNPALSRKSIVSHYFARGGIAYYDTTGNSAHLDYNARLPLHSRIGLGRRISLH